ncbi:MAG TPA: hypothetical protein VGF25_22905 [Thermoleophilaceae bacterium]|jgi:hypothetical protein
MGNGALKPETRETLEAEGLVHVEEGLRCRIRYERFRAPGRRFSGKVTTERIGLGISEKRFVLYCRSGSAELIDTEFGNPRLDILEVTLEGEETVLFRIDYDRADEPKVAGVIGIIVGTPNAATIVEELRSRMGR